jgi:ubiquinone biosynthesis protein COQ4
LTTSDSNSQAARSSERDPPFATALQPRRALRALIKLARNPDDTAQVFTIIEALSGGSPLRNLARFRARAEGRRLLAERPALLALLADREALERMPEGSLGRAYLAFLDREGITPEGLVQASVTGAIKSAKRGSDLEYMRARLRDSHDLWHTVTGWHGDVIGEIALLAFNVAQLRNPGVALIVLSALLRAHSLVFLRLAMDSFAMGRRAEWLAVVHW